jgi:DNA polymerase III epsilon subunit-like protein
MMAAIDYETTGRRPGYHEIIQIGIVPLNSNLRPMQGLRPFYTTVKPEYPERQERGAGFVHGLDINELVLHAPESGRVKDLLVEWFNSLELPFGKTLTPLACNWAFESSFTKAWLGVDDMDKIFHSHFRDVMEAAILTNDRAAFAGAEIPFARVGLKSLCRKLGVTNQRPHDALHDALAEAEVYRALCHYEVF